MVAPCIFWTLACNMLLYPCHVVPCPCPCHLDAKVLAGYLFVFGPHLMHGSWKRILNGYMHIYSYCNIMACTPSIKHRLYKKILIKTIRKCQFPLLEKRKAWGLDICLQNLDWWIYILKAILRIPSSIWASTVGPLHLAFTWPSKGFNFSFFGITRFHK